jgi:hypothetical protein
MNEIVASDGDLIVLAVVVGKAQLEVAANRYASIVFDGDDHVIDWSPVKTPVLSNAVRAALIELTTYRAEGS